eukprot:6890066-Pyramimonas_sp.AAC.1
MATGDLVHALNSAIDREFAEPRRIKVSHVFSAESDPAKRAFIKKMFPRCNYVFGDMTKLGPMGALVTNYVHDGEDAVPRN